MRQQILLLTCLCSVAVIITAVPLPANDQELDMLQIPLTDGKEIDVLTLGDKDQEQLIADRNKRTVGLLRELFPDITKQIDDIVNRIISQVIRVVGPSVLSSLGRNRPATESSNFDSDFDDDDGDDDNTDTAANSISSSSKSGTRVSIDLPTFPAEDTNDVSPTTTSTSITTPSSTSNKVSSGSGMTITITSATPRTSSTTFTTNAPTTKAPTTPESIDNLQLTTSIPIIVANTTNYIDSSLLSSTKPSQTTNIPSTFPLDSGSKVALNVTAVETTTSSIDKNNNKNVGGNESSKPPPYQQNPEQKTQISIPSNQFDVDESQLTAFIDNVNRLLNNTNYFITTRNNQTTPFTTTTQLGTTFTAPTIPPTIIIGTTVKTTKLFPVEN